MLFPIVMIVNLLIFYKWGGSSPPHLLKLFSNKSYQLLVELIKVLLIDLEIFIESVCVNLVDVSIPVCICKAIHNELTSA